MPSPEKPSVTKPAPDFTSLGISAPILKAVQNLGYEQPSPIQAQSIPILLEGKNLLGTAQTGTGKTAAFALPLLSSLNEEQSAPQVLVLTPTRELAIQVAEAFQSYARNIKKFHVLPIYGGSDIRGQLRGLQRNPQVIVGTPGRILDHLRRRSLKLNELTGLVLDEADEMLRMGFIDDVEEILSKTPENCQRALFSATMPAAIRRVANKYLGDAEQISIEAKTRTVERIEQQYLTVKSHQKMDALTRILEVEEFDGMIIFVRTKSATVEVAEKLEARGFSSAALNGDLSQTLRERTVGRLKKGQIDIIVATDVAARGLDVERISHVVNYDIPYDNESYVHRIGRTGRAGREGKAILFITPKERRLLRSIEKSTRQPIGEMSLPSNEEVSGQRIQQFTAQLLNTIETAKLAPFLEVIEKLENENKLDIKNIAAALAFETQKERPLFPKFEKLETGSKGKGRDNREHRNNDRDHKPKRDRREERERPHRDKNALDGIDMVTYRIEVGLKDGVTPKNIVGAIANEADIESQYIGHISLQDEYSTVDLPEGMPDELFQHLRKVRICQKAMSLSVFKSKDESSERKRKPAHKPSGKKPSVRKSAGKKPRKRQTTDFQ